MGFIEVTIKEILVENFVCLSLLRNTSVDISGNALQFAWYEKKRKLDFYVRSLIDCKNYGIAVKAGSNSGSTAARLLMGGKIDYLCYIKE